MKIYSLKYKQIIKKDINEVFTFFSNPENLKKITPQKLDFKILTPKPIKMKEGQLIDYTIKILGKKIRWRTIITDYNPPKMFIDQQLLGPYSMWHHRHEFNIVDNGVEIIDKIDYVVPYGILGRIVNFCFIKSDLDRIFHYRYEVINKYFNGEQNI
tara:strand:- start:36 stop:503 length:468 start_codon:yes stop_codon:yes gene_type:complete